MPKTKEREVGKQLLKRHSGKSGVRHPNWTLTAEYDCAVAQAKERFAEYGGEDLENATTRKQVAKILNQRCEDCAYSLNDEDLRFVSEATEFLKKYNLHKLK